MEAENEARGHGPGWRSVVRSLGTPDGTSVKLASGRAPADGAVRLRDMDEV